MNFSNYKFYRERKKSGCAFKVKALQCVHILHRFCINSVLIYIYDLRKPRARAGNKYTYNTRETPVDAYPRNYFFSAVVYIPAPHPDDAVENSHVSRD